jgi:molybdopterin converting factor subunit 1
MKVTVRMFASFREAAGQGESALEVEPGATVGQLWERLVAQHPRLAPMRGVAGMAVNGHYSMPEVLLSDGDVVAFLPPVSGG